VVGAALWVVVCGRRKVVGGCVWLAQRCGLLCVVGAGLWVVVFGRRKVVGCCVWSAQGCGQPCHSSARNASESADIPGIPSMSWSLVLKLGDKITQSRFHLSMENWARQTQPKTRKKAEKTPSRRHAVTPSRRHA
jgi:hypothetical protein